MLLQTVRVSHFSVSISIKIRSIWESWRCSCQWICSLVCICGDIHSICMYWCFYCLLDSDHRPRDQNVPVAVSYWPTTLCQQRYSPENDQSFAQVRRLLPVFVYDRLSWLVTCSFADYKLPTYTCTCTIVILHRYDLLHVLANNK